LPEIGVFENGVLLTRCHFVNTETKFFTRLMVQPAVLVGVVSTRGSVPRESGTWMAVFADAVLGTIGGGRLEFEAIDRAREQLRGLAEPSTLRYPLGPSLGQCCGGEVHLQFETVGAADVATLRQRLTARQACVALFGGGHVGAAIASALAPLPFSVTWIDSRDGIFPADVPRSVVCEHSDPVQGAVPSLAAGSRVLIMSFSHAEDLDIVAACLLRQRAQADLPYVGLIGSKTKWATFRHRLEARGFSDTELAHITCPIGVPGIRGKEPEVIAAAVAAQLLQTIS
jgi:xanthine dehydrogenase accessory factor